MMFDRFEIDNVIVETHNDCVLFENSINSISIKQHDVKTLFEMIEELLEIDAVSIYNLVDDIYVAYDNQNKKIGIGQKDERIRIDASTIDSIKEHLRNLGVI